MTRRDGILSEIGRERTRQDQLVVAGRIPCNGASVDAPAELIVTALSEEVGEVARAVLDHQPGHLRHELIQVAAVAVAMVEGIDAGTLELP